VGELEALVGLAQQARLGLGQHDLSIASAESCTGGLLGHVLTEVSGISRYYRGGVISYSDEVKRSQLGVKAATLARYGAVSGETCREMAEGVRLRLGTDLALAITGIAGPEGGTPAKPVGLTYVAIADEQGHLVRRFVWQGDRRSNKLASARAALELLLERLGTDGT
jgi:PncC family amidohydrolase